MRTRRIGDRVFTALAAGAFGVVALALAVILVPMLLRGAGAIAFRGTVEFRRLQYAEHKRGDAVELTHEAQSAAHARSAVFEAVAQFSRGIDTARLEDDARSAYRELGKELDSSMDETADIHEIRRLARGIRSDIIAALESETKDEALTFIESVLKHRDDPRLRQTSGQRLFAIAEGYRGVLQTVDLARRTEYATSLSEVKEALHGLFGPFPGEPEPALLMERYGATRWDQARRYLDRLLWAEKWVPAGPGEPLRKVRIPRSEQFAGTSLAPVFPMLEQDIGKMLLPRWTVYWQYVVDDGASGHYFGGIGPEIVGTLLITLLAVAIAVPLGVTSAAYLVECAGQGPVVLAIRTCINTLAGVPSIVFGLFGLAFFVLFLLPALGLERNSSILAGALTLAVLVLPIVIRASEEAIRSVPPRYKAAALALGAGRFRTFMTVILPAALPGILTGVILSMGRAAGETAPILFTAAVALGPVPRTLADPTRALSYGAYDMAVGDRIAAMVPHNQFGMIMTLVVLVLLMNMAAILVRARMSKRLRGQ